MASDKDRIRLLKRYYALECIRYLLSIDFNSMHTLRDIYKLVETQSRFRHVQASDELSILSAELEQKLSIMHGKRKPWPVYA